MSAPATAPDDGARTARFTVRPAPPREPPFDDELPARHLVVVGPWDRTLPFALEPTPRRVTSRADLGSGSGSTPPARPERAALVDPAGFSRRLAVAIIEVVTGRRSATQLRRLTGPAVQAGLARDAGRITRLGTATKPATIHSVHVAEPADGVAEVAVIVQVGARFRALALRLEADGGNWRCVRLHIG